MKSLGHWGLALAVAASLAACADKVIDSSAQRATGAGGSPQDGGPVINTANAGGSMSVAEAGSPLEAPPSHDGSACPGVTAEYKVCLDFGGCGAPPAPVLLAGCCLPSAHCGLILASEIASVLLTPIPSDCASYGSFGYSIAWDGLQGAGFVGVPPDPHRACAAGGARDAGRPLDAGPTRDAALDAP